MSILDRAKAHFDNQEIKRIEVPEWGENGEPAIIMAEPFTLADRKTLAKFAKDDDMEFYKIWSEIIRKTPSTNYWKNI